MAKYRKKPVVIEAFQFDGDFINSNGEWYVPVWARAALESGKIFYGSPCDDEPPCELYIKTLEGLMHADVGDYVIQGVNGEIYPCKLDIFAKTYEPADVPAADVATVKRGKWVKNTFVSEPGKMCSECGCYIPSFEYPEGGLSSEVETDFCPGCGSRMDAKEDSNAD